MSKTAHISRFNTEYLTWRFDFDVQSISMSIKDQGILTPIICIEFNNERYIVDGLKRYNAAKACDINDIPYIVISPDITIANLVFSLQQMTIFSSAILKLRFLRAFQFSLDADQCNRLQLPYYSHIKKDVDRILDLPDKAQFFLHQKGFSLKEIVNLLHYSADVFNQLLDDDHFFQFTKRTFDEALSLVTALTKRHAMTMNELLDKTNYMSLLKKDLTPQQRQKQWLSYLKEDASPVLLATQQKIDGLLADISLPATVSYDRTLEHTGLTIQSTIQTKRDLDDFSDALSNKSTQQKIHEVMELI
ncbi:hypothetical protein DID73_01660 [Candidatus Marinamargulisbacteria bacterium SCGC AG-343-K17]|nr:hypothetical protein DID73_01660 [Candidatus Marinamargulisbacteria bacterium SCGC AG-343-K17]